MSDHPIPELWQNKIYKLFRSLSDLYSLYYIVDAVALPPFEMNLRFASDLPVNSYLDVADQFAFFCSDLHRLDHIKEFSLLFSLQKRPHIDHDLLPI